MKKRTRMLIATGIFPPEIGGPATYAALIAEELPRHGFSVRVLPFRTVKKIPKILRHLAYSWMVVMRSRGCDIIYALDPITVGVPALLASWFMGKPFALRVAGDYAWEQGVQRGRVSETLDDFARNMAHNHGRNSHVPHSPYPFFIKALNFFQGFVAKEADSVIVPSEYLAGIVRQWGVDGRKIHIIHNAFELPAAVPSPEEARRKLILEGNFLPDVDINIVSVGRLVPWKGFAGLIEIMPSLTRRHPSIMLHIVGDGPQEKILHTLVERLRLEKSVKFHGRLSQEKVIEYMRAGTLYVLNTAYEGLSHQLLEAMACEIPIVTTAIGGNQSVVHHGKEALLVGYNDRERLARAIHTLISHPLYAQELARNAKARVARYSKYKMLAKLTDLLHVRK